MSNQLIKQLAETFSSPENMTPEKLQSLLQETLSTFSHIQDQINSKDPKETAQGIKEAMQLKEALELQTKSLLNAVGMDPMQLSEFAETLAKSKEEREILEMTKKELDEFKNQFNQMNGTEKQKKKKKIQKTWLVG